MIYQTIVAVYVLCFSSIGGTNTDGEEWHLVGAALLVFVAGCSKYTERICALCFANRPKIVRSTRNIYVYMQTEHWLSHPVMPVDVEEGTQQGREIRHIYKYRDWERENQESPDADQVKFQYIVLGEEFLPRNERLEAVPDEMVTVHNVWEHEGQQVTENYVLCVSHALFKMYKRRLVSFRLHEAYLMKTRRFFLQHFNPYELFRIVELELKFLYDYLFSKSSGTAFSRWGVAIRVLNTSVLGLALFLVNKGLREKQDEGRVERMTTYILLFVAIGVEIVQLSRLLLSDWSMVWLICADVRCRRQPRCSFMHKIIPTVIWMVGWGRKFKFGRGKYWKNQIQQLSFTEICFSTGSYSLVWKIVLCILPLSRYLLSQEWYIKVLLLMVTKAEPVEEEFKTYFFDKVKRTSDEEKPMEKILEDFQKYLKDVQDISNQIHKGVEKTGGVKEIHEQMAEEKKQTPEESHEEMVKEKMEKTEDISSDIQEGIVDEKNEITEETSKLQEEIHEQMMEKMEVQHQMVEEKVEKPEEPSKVEEKKRKPSLFELLVEEKKKKPEERKRLLMFRGRTTGKGAPRTLALEDLILAWHVATAILEKLHGQSRDADVRKNVHLSKIVSNYCIYMIVSCPLILPVHPDNARKVYTDVFSKLDNEKAYYRRIFSKLDKRKAEYRAIFSRLRNDKEVYEAVFSELREKLGLDNNHTLKLAKGIVEKYHERKLEVKEMWEELADRWAKLFMYLALYDKSSVHEEQLTKGGEFITLIWVIMGHLGLGEATFAPSGMKIG